MLTARGGNPQHAALPPGADPAGVLHQSGPEALRHQLHQARPLADTLINERLAHLPPGAALPEAVAVVAASNAQHWQHRAADIARRLHAPVNVVRTQLLHQVTTWDQNRHAASERFARRPETRNRITAHAKQHPAHRWAPLARQIDPDLIRAHDWGALAHAIERTHHAGQDVITLLPLLAAESPLSPDEPATDLRYRLDAHLDLPQPPTRAHTASRPLGSPPAQPARVPPGPTAQRSPANSCPRR